MNDLDDVIQKLLELRGETIASRCVTAALLQVVRSIDRMHLAAQLDEQVEAARVAMLHAPISEVSVAAFEREILSLKAMVSRS